MANPPITIGPFTNVPAPGSPIKSDWPQQITNYVVDAAKGYINHKHLGIDQTLSTTAVTDLTGMSISFTATPTRRYKWTAKVVASKQTADGQVHIHLTDAGNTAIDSAAVTLRVGESGTMTLVHYESGLSGTITRKLRGQAFTVGALINGATSYRCLLLVEDIGKA